MTYIFLVPYMAFMARLSGGLSAWLEARPALRRIPEILFVLPFGWAAYNSTGLWYLSVAGFVLSYFAMEMGHGTFWRMKGYDKVSNPTGARVQTIEKIVRPIYVGIFKGDIDKPLYSWVCMGAKGLLIGLAAFPCGLALALLWPLSYWLGQKLWNNTEPAEWLSGGFAGAAVVAQLWLF